MRDSEERGGKGVSTAILGRLGVRGTTFAQSDRAVDIEKLISLLSATGVDSQSKLAERMRLLYFEEIRKRLVAAKIIRRPRLATALLQMHRNDKFRDEVEQLTGVFTTNHDGLLQVAFQNVFGAVDVGFPFVSKDLDSATSALPPLLQLHGSFSWTFSIPPRITTLRRDSKYSVNTMWIPPTVLKESKNYPFNKISAVAYEILCRRCDVLRIIGASLTQNDWNVLTLLFNAQRHRELRRGTPFLIELIVSRATGEKIQATCSYLKKTIPVNYLSDGDFSEYSENDLPADSELRNVFAYWLKEKITYHVRRREFGDVPLTDVMAEIAGEAL